MEGVAIETIKIYYDLVVAGYIPCFDCPDIKVKQYDPATDRWEKYSGERYFPLTYGVRSIDECLAVIEKARKRNRARAGSIVCTIIFKEDDKYLCSMADVMFSYQTGAPLQNKYPENYHPLTHGHILRIGIGHFNEDLLPDESGHGMFGGEPTNHFPKFW